MPVGWSTDNKHYRLKYQAIQIGPDWEADKMAVYTDPKACFLDGNVRSWIKVYYKHKDGRHATAKLCESYKGASELNKCVAWKMENIDNADFTSEHTYSFENFIAVLQDTFTILNKNGKSHSYNQMVRNMLGKIKVPNNSEMNACKRI